MRDDMIAHITLTALGPEQRRAPLPLPSSIASPLGRERPLIPLAAE
jgi:hypothetical protein